MREGVQGAPSTPTPMRRLASSLCHGTPRCVLGGASRHWDAVCCVIGEQNKNGEVPRTIFWEMGSTLDSPSPTLIVVDPLCARALSTTAFCRGGSSERGPFPQGDTKGWVTGTATDASHVIFFLSHNHSLGPALSSLSAVDLRSSSMTFPTHAASSPPCFISTTPPPSYGILAHAHDMPLTTPLASTADSFHR